MTQETFWGILDDARRRTTGGDADEHADLVVAMLAMGSVEEIVCFAQWFHHMMDRAATTPLMAAYGLIHDGCHSEDGFECFRAWLIGRGRETFDAIVADADKLADLIPDSPDPGTATENEGLLFAAQTALRAKLGDDAFDRNPNLYDSLSDDPPGTDDDTMNGAADEDWISDEDAPKRLPRLAARVEAIWSKDPERPRNLVETRQPDGSTVFYYPDTLRVAFALGPDGRPIRGVGDVS